jgi:hypothetical protein
VENPSASRTGAGAGLYQQRMGVVKRAGKQPICAYSRAGNGLGASKDRTNNSEVSGKITIKVMAIPSRPWSLIKLNGKFVSWTTIQPFGQRHPTFGGNGGLLTNG